MINAKIKGQGSAIDIGGALPAILGGLNEQAFKAVSVNSTDMSEADQMQVRKNLGLYYETPEETNTVNGSDEGQIYEQPGGNTYKHISDDTPSPSKIKAVIRGGEEVEYNINDSSLPQGYFFVEIGYNPAFLIIVTEYPGFPGFPKGIYVATYPAESMEYSLEYITADAYVDKIPEKFLPEMGTSDAVQYIPQELTETQQMQARKNLGLYYEETTTERLEYDPDGQQVSAAGYSGGYFVKASDFPIELVDLGPQITSYAWNSDTSENETVIVDITPEMIDGQDDYYRVLANPENTAALPLMIVVLADSATIFSTTLTKGVWFGLSGGWHPDWVEHSATYVRKIPSKYLPDVGGGIETVELLSIPTNYANNAAESTFFSADDWTKLKTNNLCVAVLSGTPNRVFLVVHDNGGFAFYGLNDIEFVLMPYYVAGYVTVYPINGKQIVLSGLPSASMTQAELEALGFGTFGNNFYAWTYAKANTVFINELTNEQVLGVVALTSTYLEFWDATNKYVVTNQSMQLACTVTPR